MYEFKTKEELLDSFAIYSMESSGMDKVSAQEYAKMMASYSPNLGWHIRDYGSVPDSLKVSYAKKIIHGQLK